MTEDTDHVLQKLSKDNIPAYYVRRFPVFRGSDGNAYIGFVGGVNARANRIGDRPFRNHVRTIAYRMGVHLKASEVRDICETLTAYAELSGDQRDVWYRVAPYRDGIEIDVGDEGHTRIRVTPGKVEIVSNGSDTLFQRTPSMQPVVSPDERGDLGLLDRYLNLHPVDGLLMKAWISYTLAHPKLSTTNFVFLVLQGDQGSGKTFLCKIIQALIDPSIVGVQGFPRNQKDFAIAMQYAHVLFYDNMRSIRPEMADALSKAASGGALTGRQLYTDGEQHVHHVHGAAVLNGIHPFIDQPDLAQRCLPLRLCSITEKDRRSETELFQDFQADLPRIFRGLLDLIAEVLVYLPTVKPSNPERMIDFVRWLAAMEQVNGVPAGVYQEQYSGALSESMLDSLQENPLAAAVMTFAADLRDGKWSGTPNALLQELSSLVGRRAQYSADWPQNPIALSRRLRPLQTALLRQEIDVQFGRKRERKITITRVQS